MRSLKYFALFAIVGIIVMSTPAAHAQISFGINIGGGDGDYDEAPPVCQYGYYGYAPYTCAPYGYYGPQWFNSGAFIGAGPWYGRGWGGEDGGWGGDRGRWGGDGDHRGWGGEHGGGWGGEHGGGWGGDHRGGWGGGRGYVGGGFHGGGGGYRGGGGFRGGGEHGGGEHH